MHLDANYSLSGSRAAGKKTAAKAKKASGPRQGAKAAPAKKQAPAKKPAPKPSKPAPKKPVRPTNPDNDGRRVYTDHEIYNMDEAQLKQAIDDSAVGLLKNELVRGNIELHYSGSSPYNPYADALKAEVPENIYDASTALEENRDGTVEFAPWIWRLGSVQAIRTYAIGFAANNRGREFPLEAFTAKRAQFQRRIHARRWRQRHPKQQ